MRTTFLLLILLSKQLPGIASDSKQQINRLHEKCYEYLNSNLDSAFLLANEAARISSEMGYPWGEANSLYIKGYIQQLRHETTQALTSYLQAHSLLKKSNQPEDVKTKVEVLINCGILLFEHYQYQQAIHFYEEALLLSKKHSSLIEETSRIYYNLGMTYRYAGNLNLAAENTLKSLTLAKEIGKYQLILNRWNQLGLIFKDSEDFKSARKSYQKIISYCNEDGSVDEHLGLAFHNIGVTYRKEQNYDSAKYYFTRALEVNKETNIPEDIFITLLDLTDLHLTLGDYEKARDIGLKALAYEEHVIHNKVEYLKAFQLLSKAHFALQEYDQATFFDKKYDEILKRKEQNDIDMAFSSFYQQLENEQKISSLETNLRTISLVLSGIIFMTITIHTVRKRIVRKALEKSIRKIERNSMV